jgi:hypothetical protein
MNKSTQNLLIYGGLAAAVYYFFMKPNPNAATPTEQAQSAASTLQANLQAAGLVQ